MAKTMSRLATNGGVPAKRKAEANSANTSKKRKPTPPAGSGISRRAPEESSPRKREAAVNGEDGAELVAAQQIKQSSSPHKEKNLPGSRSPIGDVGQAHDGHSGVAHQDGQAISEAINGKEEQPEKQQPEEIVESSPAKKGRTSSNPQKPPVDIANEPGLAVSPSPADSASPVDNGSSEPSAQNPSSKPSDAATDEEKRRWKGFCELESIPAVFNGVLHDWGVRGVKMKDVYDLDPDTLANLPQPVYGLIFCFRYRKDREEATTCPEHLWFAHQKNANACATVALLNLLNNVPGIDLGDHLAEFKEATHKLVPELKGVEIGESEHIRGVHNLFATKRDMQLGDLHAKKEAKECQKAAKAKPKAKSKKRRRGKKVEEEQAEELEGDAHHYVAFVEVKGEVFKLDGMDQNPQKIGDCNGADWLETAAPDIQQRMETLYAAEEFGTFNLMALVKDPRISLRKELAENIHSIKAIEARLGNLSPDWKVFCTDDGDVGDVPVREACDKLGLTNDTLERHGTPERITKCLETADSIDMLLELRTRTIRRQGQLRNEIIQENEKEMGEENEAENLRHDYNPLVSRWLEMLAGKGDVLSRLHEQIIASKKENVAAAKQKNAATPKRKKPIASRRRK